MKWKGRRQSNNIEDQRGSSRGGAFGGGLGGLFPKMGRRTSGRQRRPARKGIGIGTIVMVLAAMYFFGINPLSLLTGESTNTPMFETAPSNNTRPSSNSSRNDEMKQFISSVLAHTEDTWKPIFKRAGKTYIPPKLVLFTGSVRSACGLSSAAMGPFYCPADQKVYIDFSFYDDLKRRHGAPGDFAQAYVLAHEIGHHVQNLLGTSDQVHALQQRSNKKTSNLLSVRLELQADCYAGIWANNAHELLESGDLEEAINAASAIGDDRMQKQGQGYVVPDNFTHGSSKQRVRWFKIGQQSGNSSSCNTFQ